MKKVLQHVFWFLAYIGRPFGGIRPHRVMHWLARVSFDESSIRSPGFSKVRTSWGGRLYVHPYYWLDREVILTGCYDSSLHNCLKSKIQPGMTVFDVGANVGEISIHMAFLVGRVGCVFAFEPAPNILSRLRDNVFLNDVSDTIRIFDIALGKENEDAEFYYADLDKENQGMGSLVNQKNTIVSEQKTISVVTLDDFVENNGIKKIDLIKCDIQGGEIDFIKGGFKTLEAMSPDLVMELSQSDLEAAGKAPLDLIVALEDLGYIIYAFGKKNVSEKIIESSDVFIDGVSLNIFCTKHPMISARNSI